MAESSQEQELHTAIKQLANKHYFQGGRARATDGTNTSSSKSDPIYDAFMKGVCSEVDKMAASMPLRLIDTYLGDLVDMWQIAKSLTRKQDFIEAVEMVYKHPEDDSAFAALATLVTSHLAFVMFSHRWQGQEPSHEDVTKAGSVYSLDPKDNAAKLQDFCCTAAKCGFRWAWSDTCCINKRSDAETSESINSMFKWYRHSALTIVYLHDVKGIGRSYRLPSTPDNSSSKWYDAGEIQTASRGDDNQPASPSTPSPLASPVPKSTPAGSPQTPDADSPTSPPKTLYVYLKELEGKGERRAVLQRDTQVEKGALKSLLKETFIDPIEDGELDGRTLPDWCLRGWTLQEMLAPSFLRFYSKDWTLLEKAYDPLDQHGVLQINAEKRSTSITDHRTDPIWKDVLSRATGIDKEMLAGFKAGTDNVREKLHWAAKRETTKVEDRAYSLLGVFDINMPVIYGEGDRAFIRLQEEIMKRTNDLTLFDWSGASSRLNSFLASSPSCFHEKREDSAPSRSLGFLDFITGICDALISFSVSAPVLPIDGIKRMVLTPPPGHSLVNGEMNISLFEYKVKHFGFEGQAEDGYHHVLKADGLEPTKVHLPLEFRRYRSEEFYLCRAWDRHIQRIIEIVYRMIMGKLKDLAAKVPDMLKAKIFDDDINPLLGLSLRPALAVAEMVTHHEKEDPTLFPDAVSPTAESRAQQATQERERSETKLHSESEKQKEELARFFSGAFPVYLVRVKGDQRERVCTVSRVLAKYPETKFTFSKSAERRSVI